jgi:thiamine biosynthesis lipoprotein
MRRVLVPLDISPHLPQPGSSLHELGGTTMGTSWSLKLMLPGAMPAELPDLLQDVLDRVIAEMSHWEHDSNLSRYNQSGAGRWHQLPSDFFKVIDYALWVADASGGAYDPCAGALVNCWGFGAHQRYDQDNFYAPEAAAIALILQRGDRARVQLDSIGRRLLQPGGVQLDLSSVAKGFAVDRLALCLEAEGVRHYLLEVGGELRGAGRKADNNPWWIALEQVPGDAEVAPTVLALHNVAVATSGDYRRFFQHGAMRASHTVDPRTGYPISNDVASVTVIHQECMAADALSTALSVLGVDTGLRFAEQHHVAARFLVRAPDGLQEHTSSAYRAMLQE